MALDHAPEIGLYGDVKGWLSLDEAQALYDCVLDSPCKNVLEIGSFCGRSACVFATSCSEYGGYVTCMDSFRNGIPFVDDGDTTHPIPMQEFWDNLWKYNLARYVQTIKGMHEATLPMLKGVYGTVFIDGGHNMEGVMLGFKHAHQKLVDGGFMVFHDYGHPDYPDIKICVDMLVQRYDLTVIRDLPNMMVLRKNSTQQLSVG